MSEDLLNPGRLRRAETAGLDRGLDLLGRCVADLLPGPESIAQAGVRDVAVVVVGVLREHTADQLGDRVPVRLVDRPAVELAEAIPDRQHAPARGPPPLGVALGDARRRLRRDRSRLAVR